ncbi:hypothetical protein O0I10_006565 [Lichtheimia ornata]|uniref:Helitron helicase-like domain-containing protein n=1 Tax=Lichtheimia ornata TaxID=688661 RepID=A0AAD7V3X3_9FUNG|nr:uncharacterized protein O0I10_006565 [Lichtheimia ornata]KAJ8657750.1 hypothetical protein O0I10_006565 [Lichtheimia ornata]
MSTQQTSNTRPCRCGSISHQRTSNSSCRLNARNLRPQLHSQEEANTRNTRNTRRRLNDEEEANTRNTRRRLNDEEEADTRNTRNTRRQLNGEEQPNEPSIASINNAPTNPTRLCPQCNSPTHRSRRSAQCPFNRDNIVSEHGAQYKLACHADSFLPEHVYGPNVSQQPDATYRRHTFPAMDVSCPFCGALMWMEEKVVGSSRINPRFALCCSQGNTRLPIPNEPPSEIIDLITADRTSRNQSHVNFMNNIRAYNSMFAFCSIKANYDRRLADGSDGVPTYRINGTMYHHMGALSAREGQEPKFSQIYFLDEQEQMARRTTLFSGLDNEIIEMLQRLISTVNPMALRFRSAYEIHSNNPVSEVQVVIKSARQLGRRFDTPTCAEVAAVPVENAVDGSIEPYDIVVSNRQGGLLQIINSLHKSYMALHYVLMFPYGDDGWFHTMTLLY